MMPWQDITPTLHFQETCVVHPSVTCGTSWSISQFVFWWIHGDLLMYCYRILHQQQLIWKGNSRLRVIKTTAFNSHITYRHDFFHMSSKYMKTHAITVLHHDGVHILFLQREATSRSSVTIRSLKGHIFVKTVLKLSVANFIHAQHCVWTFKGAY